MIRLLTRIFVLLIVASTIVSCAKKAGAEATTTTQAPPPLPADVQAVAPAPMMSNAAEGGSAPQIAATGEFVSPVRSELSAKIVGRVANVYVDEGSRVTKGQPLLAIESDYIRLNLQRAEADAARAKAMLDDARRDIARKKELIASNSIPQATMDRSQSAYDQANAAYASAQAQAALLRQQLADSVVRSPINGVVEAKRTNVGQRLGDNTVAMIVAQTSPLKLRFRVPERYLAN
ncbi:MAG TPA: efflux RND transporter periplasmic adaptor subunit, partial [Thermoanaerobaculia bacterium]|nr:efflux RND transporter periplasmic adaptor subunit [Thermoanaerobaculia bacterium]